ncbi:beta-lactamase/transpeptidase-like protein [Cucurbitaria berberidis CBS 394.84]|uniref:Beta-lactamase/transpeptidase-like protein n=1 Tax=Cucurbitaria berberidis CBS 394.84 TaxID=1168544 RepID=A0A9P4GEY4_9PLEO|nr:beta-lactamase/transpeptidase-like protein [Cucurbitaria berberidis CBS 394.84]KAF1844246.1 beta-lactamase/transpeptidase-like protein [Cucurbitaria berberidis CBS 394.84]
MNETGLYPAEHNKVTSDSIFRIMSVSKNFAMTSALVVETKSKLVSPNNYSLLTMNTPVRLLLPSFGLPERDWNDGGSEITLAMLASHTAGFSRESYSTGFNMILSTGKADLPTIGAAWAGASADEVIEFAKRTNLIFAPGKRAAYSNTGISILASAVAAYYNNITDLDLSWSQLVTREILAPLNMTHSFFGTVPQDLEPYIGVPGGQNWAGLIVGNGYEPAAGMWSSAVDLTRYIHYMWLQPSPTLITPSQRRQVLKPVAILPDGIQQAGPGWEIEVFSLPTSSNATLVDMTKIYSIYGKSGDGGGWHSWIDTIPNLGYGIVVLTQQSGLADYVSISTARTREIAHDILAPAFAKALSARVAERFAGNYTQGKDTSLFSDEVPRNASHTSTYAKLEVKDQILYLRELVVNGTSALEALDRLSWTETSQRRLFSTPQGVVLEPAEGAAETAEFGEGTQIWRMNFPGLKVCDWFDFDGYKDSRGWPLSKVVLVETNGGVELRYPPFDVVMTRALTQNGGGDKSSPSTLSRKLSILE